MNKQNPFEPRWNAVDPGLAFDAWRKMTEEYIVRMEQFQNDIDTCEQEAVERTCAALTEGTDLLKASLIYTTENVRALRKGTLQAVKTAKG